MHELSVAMGIVKIAEDEAKKANAKEVTKIEIEIGTLAGVELDSLNYVWPAAIKNTVLENAVKEIISIEGKGKCIDCDTVFPVVHIYDSCPKCHSNFKGIIQGKELKVKSIEII